MTSPIRVLHVDDEPDLADLTAMFLEREDSRITVTTAMNAREGLAQLAEQDFDAIISDYEMPGQNGIEFLESVRAKCPDLPFVLYTGKGSEEVASDAIAAGVTEYLQKEPGTSQYTLLANRIRNAVDQYRSRRAVEETKQTLSLFAEKTDDVFFMFTGDWSELLFVNSAYEEIWGATLPELQDNPRIFLEYVHPDDRDDVIHMMAQLSDGERGEIEYRVRQPNGEQRWVRCDTKPVFDADGTVSRIVGYVRDITEQKARERELQWERAFVDQAINTLDDIFYVVQPDGRLHQWNTRLTEAVGYTDEEIAEMNAIKLFPADEQTRITTAIKEAITTGEAKVEADVQRANGERVPYEFTGTRLTDPKGELVGLVGIGRNMADQKARERALQRERDRLEEFASVVSHDLRNPLNVAMGRLALAREENESEQLAAVAQAHDRMDTLIADLLTLARDGKQVRERESVAFADLVDICWQNVATAEATLTIACDQQILADYRRLQQLVENLFRNAITHGGTDVHVTVGTLTEGFYVEDTGPGIPRDERDKVFDIGYSTAAEGTGFGLAIVTQIANAHGWDIRVTEASDGGARFEFTSVEFTPG